jgi:hypothetical protein
LYPHKSCQVFVDCSGEEAWRLGRELIEVYRLRSHTIEAAMYRLEAETGISFHQWRSIRYDAPPRKVLLRTLETIRAYHLIVHRITAAELLRRTA